ncbi:MAG: transketolase [Proteobacteria bacterium]|nr:transketolase [Pseudomonadota bacterium]
MPTHSLALSNERPGAQLRALAHIDERLRWLATWTIHHANHIRPSRDGLKVGGHQASCASMTTIMTALYFHALRPQDRVAVKPHASPVFHAAQYLMGRQTREQLEAFRSFGGAQSYPSRTKDADDVDFSTGSVGLGVAITAFASLAQDWLAGHGLLDPHRQGRFVATLGDAELDEGNIYECLIEAYKHDIRNVWWIVDYNRQSLDATTADRMFDRFDDIFETAGWRVVTLKWGKAQLSAFARPGGLALKAWIESCSNAEYAALTYQGGAAWRARLLRDIGGRAGVEVLLASFSDDELHDLMIGLGGHCIETLTEAFDVCAADDTPTLFIAYTVKGFGLPLQGHKDNHAGLMTPSQVEALRAKMGVPPGEEWEPLAGLSAVDADEVRAQIAAAPFAQPAERRFKAAPAPVPSRGAFPSPEGAEQATQSAFGRILLDLAKSGHPIADRIVTTSPDVTVSTNLGGFVNQRGLFRRRELADVFREAKIPSPQKWAGAAAGQHVELGIAEHNLFLNLAAFGLTAPLFGERLLPIGTVYDPFISRGLDALNYACYQDARFMLVATPSGLTLGPEGGAHQSIYTPLVGMGQPGLTYFEPAFVDELSEVMRWSFEHMQADDGGSVYLRLTTRAIAQAARDGDAWREDALKGAYWLKAPGAGCEAAIVFCGAVAPEVLEAAEALGDDLPGLGVLNVVSPGLLHRDWIASRRARWREGSRAVSHAEAVLGQLAPGAGLVTVIDGSPATLSWLGGVLGQRVSSLGTDSFGQVGDLVDLYRRYRLDCDAIVEACADLFLDRAS